VSTLGWASRLRDLWRVECLRLHSRQIDLAARFPRQDRRIQRER